MFILYRQSQPNKNPEGLKPQAPNLINWKHQPQNPKPPYMSKNKYMHKL